MQITVLVDNNTIIDRYLLGEPGVSFLIREGGKNILFDVGYSDIFITNARKLGISLYDVDYTVISHGHIDHTWGLEPMIRMYSEAKIENIYFRKPVLIAHPQAFESKYNDNKAIGSVITEKTLGDFFEMNLKREPFWITDRLAFLGEIERTNSFENKKPIGKRVVQGIEESDFLMDDTALAYKSEEGLVIITGCSHSGICNIINYAKQVCNDDRITDVIGGLHLLNPEVETLERTKEFIRQTGVKKLHPCHCTDLKSKLALSEVAELEEVGAGLVLEF
ncbi:MAG: MBL fold metallo-hydrolase [Gracilibacteraceae bacterium]|jgi:7,8-dihydropterin-6-yl-methyl-4-(beta-D-ribofuranosyl)aminobenzene 5'-phosphate synthase|nr:MBL fold metallo-hydrolase [Gracilibacteraceae bacterium]